MPSNTGSGFVFFPDLFLSSLCLLALSKRQNAVFWNCSCPVAPSSQSGFSVGMRTIRIGLPANWKQTANGKIGNLLLRSCFLCRQLILLMVFASPHSLRLCGNLPLCPSSMQSKSTLLQSVDDGSCLRQRKPWERRCLVTKRCVVFTMKFSVSGSVAGAAERTGPKEKNSLSRQTAQISSAGDTQ